MEKQIAFSFEGMTSTAKKIAYNILYAELKKLGYEWYDPSNIPTSVYTFLQINPVTKRIAHGDVKSTGRVFTTIESFLSALSEPPKPESKFSVGDYVFYNGFAIPIKTIGAIDISLDTQFTGKILDPERYKLNWHHQGWWICPANIRKATPAEIGSTILAIAEKVYPLGTIYESVNPKSSGIHSVKAKFEFIDNERVTDKKGGSVWHIKYGWAKKIDAEKFPIYKVGDVVICIKPDEQISKVQNVGGTGYKLGRVFQIKSIDGGELGQQILFPQPFAGENSHGVYSNSVKLATLEEIRDYLQVYVEERGLTHFTSTLWHNATRIATFDLDESGIISKGNYIYETDGHKFSEALFKDIPLTLFTYNVRITPEHIAVGCKQFTYSEAKAIGKFFQLLEIKSMDSLYFTSDKSKEDIPKMLEIIDGL